MFDDNREQATVLSADRDGPRFANLHWFFSEAASPAPHVRHARSRFATRHTPIVDGCCGPGQVRVLSEAGFTADGKHP